MTVTLTDASTPRRATEQAPSRSPSAATASPTEQLAAETTVRDIVEVWGLDSFPASDAPANW